MGYYTNDVFEVYKSRNDVDDVHGIYKNLLQVNIPYLQIGVKLRGYVFVSLASLHVHYRILKMLKKIADVNEKSFLAC